jgi:phosphopantothenate-cysteine ligase
MNIVITSGGATEPIDTVRGIANHATGRLGSLIAERFECETVFYLCPDGAAKPKTGARTVAITDVRSLEQALRGILGSNHIDAVIHAMAVSDYRVKSIRSASGAELGRNQKISSDESELTLILEQTPKVISLLRPLAPEAVIVGFKLLDGATDAELVAAANETLQKNKCSFVLANDRRGIHGDDHRGILLDRSGAAKIFETKQEIAAGIYEAVMEANR